MKHNLIALSALSGAMLFVGAGCAGARPVAFPAPSEQSPAVSAPAEPPAGVAGSVPTAGITAAEVAAHATPEDCWFIINGKVYDVSGYATRHPGGRAVYAGCGKDATVLFETRPGGSGTPHSEKARSYMANYEIGAYKP